MRRFNTLSEPMKIAYIGAIGGIIAATVGAFIGGIFLLKSISPNQASPTATTSITAAATFPVSITSTVNSTSTPTANTTTNPYGGRLVLDDSLNDNSNGYSWDVTEGHCIFKGGAYHVTTSRPKNYECNTTSPRTDFSNFAYQITMKIDKGNQGGICFRFIFNDQTGYCFFLDLNGRYVLEKVNLNTRSEEMLETGQSNYFLTGLGKTNQIAVRAQGNAMDLFINGHFIQTAKDSTFSHGQIGVFLVYPDFFTEAEFTDAKVWVF